MNNKRYRPTKKKLMPKEAAVTREELRNAIHSHLSVILPDTFDDEDVVDMTSAVISTVEDCINYLPRKAQLGKTTAREAARKRAKRGGLPVLTADAHKAIDVMIGYFDNMLLRLDDTPEYAPVVNEFLGLSKIAKAWIDSQPVATEQQETLAA